MKLISSLEEDEGKGEPATSELSREREALPLMQPFFPIALVDYDWRKQIFVFIKIKGETNLFYFLPKGPGDPRDPRDQGDQGITSSRIELVRSNT